MKINTIIFSIAFFIIASLNLSLRSQVASRPFSFKENKGQVCDQFFKTRTDILFYGTDGKLAFYLKNNGISYQLDRVDKWEKVEAPEYLPLGKRVEKITPSQRTIYRIDINWLNANTLSNISKGTTSKDYENYYNESCAQGALDIRTYEDLIYQELYPGIDLKWYTKNGALKYDYIVKANTDYKQIKLEYKGAEKISINKNGDLIIKTSLGELIEQKPVVIQNGKKLEAKWLIKENIVSFEIKNIDPSQAFVIDPMVRLWGTYYGGTGDDTAFMVQTDNVANVYVCGMTESITNIASSGAHQITYGGAPSNWGDAYVVKFDQTGLRLWATYYGGAQADFANACAIDVNGDVLMIGGTSSTNSAVMATPGAHQSTAPAVLTSGAVNDAFLVKFNSAGVRQWGTYYGGNSYEWAYYVSTNPAGDILISGATHSSDGNSIATPGCHQPAFAGGVTDAFIALFNTAGVRQWGTYYGGPSAPIYQDDAIWCAFDASGDIYISGNTPATTGIATPGAHQPTSGGGQNEGFLSKFTSAGQLIWGTYYGGAGLDYMGAGAIDASGNIYIVGASTSSVGSVIATPGSHQSQYGGNTDAFLVKFNSSGIRQWGTYYGGTAADGPLNASIDPFGTIYMSGFTSSNSGTVIATTCSYDDSYNGGSSDGFLAKFDPSGSRIWGSYYGSIFTDYGYFCATDIHANVYLTGITYANSGTVIANSNAHQPTFSGSTDGFVAKFNGCIPGSAINTTPPANLLICAGESTTLTSTCGNWYSSPTGTTLLSIGDFFTTGPLTADTTFYVEDFGCGAIAGTRTAIQVSLIPLPPINIASSNTAACVAESVTLTASGAVSYSWEPVSSATSTLQMFILLNVTHTVFATDANGCKNTATISVVPQLCIGIEEQSGLNKAITIYPNPNNGNFTIRSGIDLNLTLYNELGQTLRLITLSSENNFETTLKDLPNGVYFLSSEKENRILNQKIIVMR